MNILERIIKLLKCCRKNQILDEVIEVATDTSIILNK